MPLNGSQTPSMSGVKANQSQPHVVPKSMRKRKRWPYVLLGLLFGCPCLLVGVGLAGFKWSLSGSGGSLAAELAAARRAGIPAEPDDLRKLVALPEKDNAASDYQAAFGRMHGWKPAKTFSTSLANFLRMSATAKEEKEVREATAKASGTLDLIVKASSKPGVDWHRRWEDGPNVMFPEFSDMKRAAKLLCAKAILLARADNSKESWRLLAAAARIGMNAGLDPSLIGALVQCAIDNIATAAMCSVLGIKHDGATLNLARRIVRDLPPLADLARAMGGDLVMHRIGIQRIVEFTEPQSDWIQPYQEFPGKWLVRDPGFRTAMEARIVHYDREVSLAFRNNHGWKQRKAAIDNLDSRSAADHSLDNRLAMDIVASYSGLADPPSRSLAYRHMLAAAIEVHLARNRTGRMPSQLPDLGENGNDPFSEKPLGYKLAAGGFKVYSVDTDGVDDGGLTRAEDKRGRSKTHDLAMSFR